MDNHSTTDPSIYNHVYDCGQVLSEDKVQEVLDLIGFDQREFEESPVYHVKEDLLTVNKHLRSSERVKVIDDRTFEWTEQNLIEPINEHMEDVQFTLLRSDVEAIRYKKGDFFKKHSDFISYNSNLYCNYTMLVCLKPCLEGGETLIEIDEEDVLFETSARVKGGAIIFKKEAVHAGTEILAGEKVVMMLNLFAFPKTDTEDMVMVQVGDKMYPFIKSVLEEYPNMPYSGFYQFQKRLHENQNVFFFQEEVLNQTEFEKFYCKLMGIEEENQLASKLDYLGIIDPIPFIGEEKVKIVPMKEYYQMLAFNKDPTIIPFQMITLETEGKEIIAWFGCYDNRALTWDILEYNSMLYYGVDACLDDIIYQQNCGEDVSIYFKNEVDGIEYIKMDECESIEYDRRDGRKRIHMMKWTIDGEEHQTPIDNIDIETTICNSIGLLLEFETILGDPERFVDNIKYFESGNRYHTMVRQKIFEQGKGKKLLSTSKTLTEQIPSYITELLSNISAPIGGGGGSSYSYIPKKRTKLVQSNASLVNQFGTEMVELPEIAMANLTFEQVEEMREAIQAVNVISDLSNMSTSEYHCNEDYYITLNVLSRFGYYLLKV